MGLNWGKNLKILERLLPDEGYICLIGLSDDGPMQTFHLEWEEVYKQIDLLLSIGKNVHFALSTFDIEKRNREAVTGVKSFWLDIDCGENKDYPSQAIAIKEVMGFCKKQDYLDQHL